MLTNWMVMNYFFRIFCIYEISRSLYTQYGSMGLSVCWIVVFFALFFCVTFYFFDELCALLQEQMAFVVIVVTVGASGSLLLQ